MLSPELTLLMQGRAILSDPKKWTRNAGARDDDGENCPVSDPRAICWCSTGILDKLTGNAQVQLRDRAVELLRENVFHIGAKWYDGMHDGVEAMNDASSHEEVMKVWDITIAKQYAKETTAIDPESLRETKAS